MEGPSAAGKTTWVRRHAARWLVPESGQDFELPTDAELAAHFWAQRGAERWAQALRVERADGVAVCDTDPLKLHYAWSLWRIGEGDKAQYLHHAAAYRSMLVLGRLGFADAFMVSIPDADALGVRRSADQTRQRRNFDLHRRLAEPLREWYGLVEDLRPGSVTWTLPDGGLEETPFVERNRSDIVSFDALVEAATRLVAGSTHDA